MVAIVSGHSLGLDLTSLRTLGPQEFTGNAAHGRNAQGVYVNAATGNLVVQGLDAFVTSVGADVAAVRTYNSQGLLDDDNGSGDNWSNGYFLQPLKVTGTAKAVNSTIHLTGRDGAVAKFTWNAQGFYISTDGDGAHDTIRVDDALTRYTWTDGSTGAWRQYDAANSYRLATSGEPAGKVLTYAYDEATGQLKSVLNSDGEGTRYVYTNGRLTGLETVKGTEAVARITYEYDAGRLWKVTVDLSPGIKPEDAADVYWTEYAYEGASSRVASIRQSDGTKLNFGYVADNGVSRIQSIANAYAEQTTFAYTPTATGMRAVVTDPLGHRTIYDSDTKGQLVRITPPGTGGVNPTRSFVYDSQGNLLTDTDGEGRVVAHVYNEWGNSILQTDSAGGRVERQYDGWNQLTVETVFLKADPDGTGDAQATAPVSTRQFWSATVRGQLLFVVSAEGRVTEHRYDGHGQRTHTIEYLGAHYDLGHAPLTAAELSTWTSKRDKSSTGLVRMDYDGRGNLWTRTTFARVDATGGGVDGTKSVETFVHDQRGLLIKSISATRDETAYSHDGLGRLETTTNALGQTSITRYLDSQQKVVHTFPLDPAGAGLVSTSFYDLAGRHISTVHSGGGVDNLATTNYGYDAAGRLCVVTDPTGRKQWILYTNAGYKAAEIDANGTMKEYGYDASGRIAWTRLYDNAVNTASLVAGTATPADLRPAAIAASHRTWHTYDAAGRLVRTAATVGAGDQAAVTEWQYDGASRLVSETRYATAVPVSAQGFTTVPLPVKDLTADRITRHFHDRDGLLRGTLDSEGYLTELRYNSLGQLVQRIGYARATLIAHRAVGSLADLIPTSHPKDIQSDYFYDGHGRRVGELDGERYLTEHRYDANGRLSRTLRYEAAVVGEVATLQAAITGGGPARTETIRAYDALGRLANQTNSEGTATLYRYDTAGNLTTTIAAWGTAEARERAVRYDLMGRITAELSPESEALLLDTMTPAEVEAIWSGHATRHTYDDAGRRISTTNSLNHSTYFYYDEDGALRYTVDAIGRVRERVYDARGRLEKEIERVGRIGTADLTGKESTQALGARVEAAGHVDDATVGYAYTRDGAMKTSTSATGHTTTYLHNAFGEVVTRTQDMGGDRPSRVEAYGYDRRGLLAQTTQDPGAIDAVEKAEYDAFGRVIRTIDAIGNGRSRVYDRLGRVVTTFDAVGAKRETSYDAFSRTLTHTDALLNFTKFAYDDMARSVTVTTPEGIESTTFKTRHGEEARRVNGLRQRTDFVYDLNGRLVETATPVASAFTSYDALGRVSSTRDPNGNLVNYEYDKVDRVKTRTVVVPDTDPSVPPKHLVTRYAYQGREVRVTDPAGVVTLTSYDKNGRVATQVIDEGGLNLTTKYSYNPADQVLTVTNGIGTVSKYVYDALGRRESEIVDLGGLNLKRSWTYDDAGNVLTSTDPGGNVTRYAYDAEGRLQFTVDPVQAVTKRSYDANGNLVSQVQFATPLSTGAAMEAVSSSSADRKSYWAYDRDNRLVFEVDALRGLTERVYDDAGNVVRRTAYAKPIDTVPDVGFADTEGDIRDLIGRSATDRTVRFAYDAGGRLKYQVDATGSLQETRYDAGGLLQESIRYATRLPIGDGNLDVRTLVPVTNVADQKEVYEYDALGRLVKTTDAFGRSEISAYDDIANRKTFTNKKGDTWTYLHDAAGRLTEERSPETQLAWMPDAGLMSVATTVKSVVTRLAYDDAGNLISRTEAHGRPEERTTTYGYDAAGRQVSVKQGSAQVYNAQADSLSTVSVTASETSATLEIRTVYDSLGNAVANIDVGGALSQKTYDAAGRVLYEVDALGYVTGYRRNTFGEVAVLTRYATGTRLEVREVTRSNQAVTTGEVEAALTAVGVDPSNGRTLTSTYDLAGRVTRVQEMSADTFDPAAAAAASRWHVAGKTTDTDYNAFGEAVAVRSLRNAATDKWSVARRFYDGNGRERASLDALGYVTERTFDAFGNLVSVAEYANAAEAGWTVDGYTRGAGSANDRKTEYEYDKGNRKVLERRRGVEYSAAPDGTSVVGDVVTEYRYDAVGNQITVIDANNRATRTYYDALGRVSAILQPQTSVITPDGGELPTFVNPLITFLRDAHGHVLREKRHANGATAPTVTGFTEGVASPDDRVVRTRYDRLGRAVQVSDARGHQQFLSYDAYGRVAKRWQPLEDTTGRVTYEVNTYDRLGQLVSVRRPGTTMQVQGGITARWITVPYEPNTASGPPRGGELQLGWTELEGARVRVEVTYTTPAYDIKTPASTPGEYTTTHYPARTVTVVQEKSALQAPVGLTVVFQDPVAKIGTIRVTELKGTTWVPRWEGSYLQAQGTGVKEVDQGIVEEKVLTTRYNAFGEVVAHLADGATAEYFHYDGAGRLWRTNAGDGVDKIFLYDAQGNRTSEIRSPGDARGDADLRIVASAEEAHEDIRNRRIDFTYDAAGRLVQKTDAARLESQGGLSVRQMLATSTVQVNASPFYVQDTEDSGHFEPGTSRVKLTWTNLAVLGSGDVKVRVSYQTASSELGSGGAAVFESEVFASHEAAQGLILSWTTKPIASISEITVWKKDGAGTWTQVIKQPPGTSTYQIDLEAASNRWAAEFLRYKPSGSTGEHVLATLTDFGDRAVWGDLAGLAAGTYEYQLGVTPQGQEQRQFGSGTFTIAANRVVTEQTTDHTDKSWQRPVVYQKVDRWGNVVELSDPRSADWKTVYAYNDNNQMVMQRLPSAGGVQENSNPTTRIYYDALGRQVAVRDALGNVNGTVYGPSGTLVGEQRADGTGVTHRYNAFGEKVATTDARGNVQSFTYDKGGNLVKLTKGTELVYDVDANQQVSAAVSRAIEERWTYDALGRRLVHVNGENETTSYRYDLQGNVIEVAQPMGQKTYAAFDAQGRKIAAVDANGYEATWQYDYFGKLLAHTDIGGAKYTYTFDNARQLVKQTNSRDQQLAYKYDAAGQVVEIRDTQPGYPIKVTTYAYDLSGRRLLEKTVSGAEVHQDNRLAYDAQGKLRDVADTRVRMQLAYDANGNRTSVSTTVRYDGVGGEVLHKTSRYFKYDTMNRQTVVDAVDAAGTMGQGTHELTYDDNGNRASDTYLGYSVIRDAANNWTVRQVRERVTEAYAYDKLNRLAQVKRDDMVLDRRYYDAADRVVRSGGNVTTAYLEKLNELVKAGHVGRPDIRINRYDANGRMLHQSVKQADGKAVQEISWDPAEAPREVPASLSDAYRAEGYDHAGNVKGYTVFTHEGSRTVKYSTKLERYEGYVGTHGSVTDSVSGETGRNKQVYDANGHLARVEDHHLTGNYRTFVNDAQGRALSTLRGGHVQRQLIVNGEVMGRYGVGTHDLLPTDSDGYPNFTNVADFNFGFASVSPTNPAPSPGAYIVQAGDTLQTIARGAYGDSALWYLIAQANGLASDDDVRVGQVLNVPNRVGTVHNNESTFKPYDPSKMTGDLAPSLPLPGPDACGAVAQILMLIVAIVVTIYTAGAAAAAMSATAATTAGTAGYAAVGTAALTGSYGTAGLAAAAIGGAAGSIASQAVGLATGAIDEFSWKNVALSAIGAGVSSGLGGWAPLGGPVTNFGNVVVRAVIGNTIAQGIGVATGLQKNFDWKAVAASAVGAAVSHGVSEMLSGGTYTEMGADGRAVRVAADPVFGRGAAADFTQRAITGFAAGMTVAAMRGGSVSVQQVAVDAFGNALGQSIADNAHGVSGSSAAGSSGSISEESVDWLRQELGLPQSVSREGVLVAEGKDVLRIIRDPDQELFDQGLEALGRLQDLKAETKNAAAAARKQAYERRENAIGGPVQYWLGTAPVRMTEYTPASYGGGLIDIPSSSLSQLEPPSEALQTLGVAAESTVRAAMELALTAVDLVQAAGGVAYTTATGRPADLPMYSSIGRGAQAGATVGETLQGLNPMYGLLVAQHDIRHGLERGDTRPLAAFGGSLFGGAVVGAGMTRLPAASPRFVAPQQPVFGTLQPPARAARPSWRVSEQDLEGMYGQSGYTVQASFLKGQPASRGTAGSTRPDLYAPGESIDIKNYNLATARGQRNLVRDVVAQAQHRTQNLPVGDVQKLVIDARGQNVSTVMLNRLAAQIHQRSNGIITAQDVKFWR